MKALTFIQFYTNHSDTFYIYLYQKFINQDFNPEMILELFKGFKQGIDARDYLIGNFTIFLKKTKPFLPYTITNDKLYQTYFFSPPQTLSDFINDCQRAGIELEWSESALKQYEFLNN